jgi:hypothetical protein
VFGLYMVVGMIRWEWCSKTQLCMTFWLLRTKVIYFMRITRTTNLVYLFDRYSS